MISAGVNLLLSLPYLVLVLVMAIVFGRSLLNVILMFGITDAPLFIRLVRGEAMRIKQTDYRHYLARLARKSRCIHALCRAIKLFVFAWNRRQLYRQRYPNYSPHLIDSVSP